MLEPKAHKFVGHNPLAQLAMFCFLIALLLLIVTGRATRGNDFARWHVRSFSCERGAGI